MAAGGDIGDRLAGQGGGVDSAAGQGSLVSDTGDFRSAGIALSFWFWRGPLLLPPPGKHYACGVIRSL